MADDRVIAALDQLGPEDRALIELYVEKQLGDEEIAGLMQVDVARVTERRRRAFDRLAAAAGADSGTARAELVDALRGEPAEPLMPAEEPPRIRTAWLVALAAGVAAVVALVLALADGGDGEEPGDAFDTPAQEPAPTRPVALRPPAGGPARGSARLVREGDELRLSLTVRGLPAPGRDRYALWLYDSVTATRHLASFPRGTFRADVPLPDAWDRYRYFDLSREPGDSNPAHGGQSVLRLALDRLRAPVR